MLYKEKNQIIEWLNKYEVKNYTLIPDETYGYVVDVAGDVYLLHNNLIEIPVKFGVVSGYFDCTNNKLTSLEGCPNTVGGILSCYGNQLTTLKYGPHTIGGFFDCSYNQLISLEGVPEIVGENFYCGGNPKLGELQDMIDFKTIQAYLLANQLANALNIKDNKKKIKL